ncbi:MAG: AAA family ATPase [Fibrobacteres bacterium]|nr:AAA family ATPase [Fibrobacterota bacterium]
MKIETITINGFKKLKQFSIDPAGKSVEIMGRNGEGKSSIIDGTWCALTGKDVPGVPVNRESVTAKIVVGLDDGHTARLSFSSKGNKSLVVEGPDGEPVKAPATFLENLIGKISFDPFEFVNQTPQKQRAFLQQLLGLDFADLESAKAFQLEQKREIDRDAVAIEREAEALLDARNVERVDVSDLVAKQNERAEVIAKGRDAAAAVERAESAIEGAKASVASLEEQIASLEEQIAALNGRLESAKAHAATEASKVAPLRTSLERLRAQVAGMPDNSEAIRNAGETNRQAERWAKRLDLVARSKSIRGDLDVVKAKLEAIESERHSRIMDAKFPVPGLTFSVDGVLFNGLPFDSGNQCQSDILRVGVAIAVAQNPTARIVRIKDGSLLDSSAKAALLAMLAENGFQAFIETVADCDLTAHVIEEIDA